jgi:hypothetical protein
MHCPIWNCILNVISINGLGTDTAIPGMVPARSIDSHSTHSILCNCQIELRMRPV